MVVSTQEIRRLSNDLVVLAARLVRDVRRHEVDLPPASVRVLSLLDEHGASTVSALAAADRCSQPTMTGLVNGLVERGWAKRSPHPDDARASLVELSRAGREQLSAVRRRNATLLARRIAASGRSSEQTAADLRTAVAVLADLLHPDNDEESTL